jgi:hypothetical protein
MDFEERLNDLVNEAMEAGVTADEVISAFELKTMAINEETAADQEVEE